MTYELQSSKRTLRVESAKSVLNDLGTCIVESRRTKIYLQSISAATRYVLKYTLLAKYLLGLSCGEFEFASWCHNTAESVVDHQL